jgi:hypothetical protein
MWATEPHEGITGVTFDSDGHRLVGTLYLARGEERKPTVPEEFAFQLALAAEQMDGLAARYIEVEGANHAFSWHRAELANLIAGWLGAVWKEMGVRA